MHAIDWIIVFVLNGSVIALGFYLARGTYSSGEWFLGRRALPWWGIGLSMFATNVDNADLVSVTSKTYTEGLHIITVYAIGSALGGILAAFFVTPAMYRAGFYTNAEYLEARFGVAARVLSALIQIQYRSSMLGLMLYSVFLLLTGLRIMGPTAAWMLIVAMVICSGIYTAWGGLKSVVWTDAFQGIVMMIGAAVIFAAVWNQAGGWSGVETALAGIDTGRPGGATHLLHIGQYGGGPGAPFQLDLGDRVLNLGPLVAVAGWTIIGSGYWTVNHTQTMRLMGARSIWDMKMAALAGVGLSLPPMIACACLGVFGRSLPQFQDLADPDSLYPVLAREFLTVGWKGFVVAGVVAAAVSTFDSMGSALSAIFTRDIYARLITTDQEDHHYVIVGRWATIAVLMLGFLYLPFILLQRNMLDAFTTLIPVFVTPLFTLYLAGVFTRAARPCGLFALAVGSLYGLFALYCREAPKIEALPDLDWVPLWLTNRWAALCWSFGITAASLAVSMLWWGRLPDDARLEVEQTGWLHRSSETLPPLREHPFRQTPGWWLHPALYAALLMASCLYVVFYLFW